MELLKPAALITNLTGLAVTHTCGAAETLAAFEERFCLSPALQAVYTAAGLAGFLRGADPDTLYDLAEPMGTRTVILRAGLGPEGVWLLLGPYVEDSWNERAARGLLAGLGAAPDTLPVYKSYFCSLPIARRDTIIRAGFLLGEQLGHKPGRFEELRLAARADCPPPAFSEVYANAAEVNRRYRLEDRFIDAIRQGRTTSAFQAMREMNREVSGIRFISGRMSDQLASGAILRTLIRIGAKQAQLSPVWIDSASQEYAQRMRHASSEREIIELSMRMIELVCAEVRAVRQAGWSPAVRRAADYIEVNLSRQMTTGEIAAAAQADRRRLTAEFRRQTGRTIKQYLTEKRCDAAAGLLQTSAASVQQVAAWVGYADNNYFSKVFRARYGVTPTGFRESRGRAAEAGRE